LSLLKPKKMENVTNVERRAISREHVGALALATKLATKKVEAVSPVGNLDMWRRIVQPSNHEEPDLVVIETEVPVLPRPLSLLVVRMMVGTEAVTMLLLFVPRLVMAMIVLLHEGRMTSAAALQ